MIEAVSEDNIKEVNDFLLAHEETAQFLINNLKLHGPQLTDHPNSGNFKAIRIAGEVIAVFCLSRRGNLLLQCRGLVSQMILESCAQEKVKLTGFIGEWDSVKPVYDLFRVLHPDFSPTYNSKEIMYAYDLAQDDQKIKYDLRVRYLGQSDFKQWNKLSEAYMKELNLPNSLSSEQQKSDFEFKVKKKILWGLFENSKLVSKAELNSSGTVGQVGGVFTLFDSRERGLAKATMLHLLKDTRDFHLHRKSVLFTGESDLPAQKLYESIGYRRIGHFALILGG